MVTGRIVSQVFYSEIDFIVLMEFAINNVNRVTMTVILFAAIGTVMVSALPAAFALPGMSTSTDPTITSVGGTDNVGPNGPIDEDFTNVKLRQYNIAKLSDFASFEPDTTAFASNGCFFVDHFDDDGSGGGTAGDGILDKGTAIGQVAWWDMYNTNVNGGGADGIALLRLVDGDSTGTTSIWRFGDQGNAESVDDDGGNTGVIDGTLVGEPGAQAGANFWKDSQGVGVENAGVDIILNLAPFPVVIGPQLNYPVASCGDIIIADPITGIFAFAGNDGSKASFFTQSAVAGEFLPIDMTAVAIAGIYTNAMWILPVLALAAVAGFTLLRFQVKRN